jgi:hypothetical protein
MYEKYMYALYYDADTNIIPKVPFNKCAHKLLSPINLHISTLFKSYFMIIKYDLNTRLNSMNESIYETECDMDLTPDEFVSMCKELV